MQIPMEMDMQIPAGGDERSSNTYTYSYIHNSKRVGATKRDEENDSDRSNNNRWGRGRVRGQIRKKIQRQCSFWLAGNCKHAGGDCKYLHSHVIRGSEVTFLAKLAGHDNKVGFLICSAYSWFGCFLLCIFLVSSFLVFLVGSPYSFDLVVSLLCFLVWLGFGCFLVSLFSLHLHLVT